MPRVRRSARDCSRKKRCGTGCIDGYNAAAGEERAAFLGRNLKTTGSFFGATPGAKPQLVARRPASPQAVRHKGFPDPLPDMPPTDFKDFGEFIKLTIKSMLDLLRNLL